MLAEAGQSLGSWVLASCPADVQATQVPPVGYKLAACFELSQIAFLFPPSCEKWRVLPVVGAEGSSWERQIKEGHSCRNKPVEGRKEPAARRPRTQQGRAPETVWVFFLGVCVCWNPALEHELWQAPPIRLSPLHLCWVVCPGR